MDKKPNQAKLSVTLTEDEIWFILNECSYAHEACGGHWLQPERLAKKLQGRLEVEGLEQSHAFCKPKTKQELETEKLNKVLLQIVEGK